MQSQLLLLDTHVCASPTVVRGSQPCSLGTFLLGSTNLETSSLWSKMNTMTSDGWAHVFSLLGKGQQPTACLPRSSARCRDCCTSDHQIRFARRGAVDTCRPCKNSRCVITLRIANSQQQAIGGGAGPSRCSLLGSAPQADPCYTTSYCCTHETNASCLA